MRSTSLTEALKSFLRVLPLLLLPFLLGGWSAPGDQTLHGNQSTFDVHGPVAERQLYVFYVTLWVCLAIFVVVGAVLAYATFKFRARSIADEHAEPPPQGHGNPLVEIGLIVVSIVALVIIAVPTLKNIWYTQEVPAEYKDKLMTVKATGYQWWFRFEYTEIKTSGADGKDTADNLVVGNELVIPVDTPVKVLLRSQDVIHSFWLPKLAGKVDMIPNRGNFLWMLGTKPGYYWGQCAEYCGEEHGNMRFRAIVLSKEDWAKWVEKQKAGGRSPSPATTAAADQPRVQLASLALHERNNFDGDMFTVWQSRQAAPTGEDAVLIEKGRNLFADKGCNRCHTVRGHDGLKNGQRVPFGGITGPDLTHFGARTTIAAAIRDNTPENLKQWVTHPDDVKPGNKMWREGYNKPNADLHAPLDPDFRVNDQEADALVAYLHSLR